MNNIQTFTNAAFGDVRAVELNGEPWLVGKDVASALGYSNPRDAIAKHVDDEDKGVTKCDTLGGIQNLSVINESGLYSLVFSSKLPNAKKFRHWVTSEILPSIRKHGMYATDQLLDNPDFAIEVFTQLKEERERRKELESENELQKQALCDAQPKLEYYDQILASVGTMTTSQVAADYDLSARALNKILHDAHLQHNVGGQWILYREHMGRGYTQSITIPITRSDGRPDTKLSTRWTQKGRLKIHEILTARGIKANMDKIRQGDED